MLSMILYFHSEYCDKMLHESKSKDVYFLFLATIFVWIRKSGSQSRNWIKNSILSCNRIFVIKMVRSLRRYLQYSNKCSSLLENWMLCSDLNVIPYMKHKLWLYLSIHWQSCICISYMADLLMFI